MSTIDCAIIVEALPAAEGGGFIATVPDLLGCTSDGETPQEALLNVQDTTRVWIEAAKDMGHTLPEPTKRSALSACI